MHFNALRSLTQPCMTACCLYHNIYDAGISPGSALGHVYLKEKNGMLARHFRRCNARRLGNTDR